MDFRVLGPLQILVSGIDICPTAPKLRKVVSLLVLRNNQTVPTDALIDEVWGERPPASALATMQTYVYKLRMTMWPDLPQHRTPLQKRPSGYALEIQPDSVDLHHFTVALERGSAELRNGDATAAADTLRRGLDLWRGPLLADVPVGDLLTAYAARLEEQRLVALEQRIEADLRLGRYQDLISELKHLVWVHPLHEAFYSQLLVALYRCDRRGEALEVYRRLRKTLIDELGLDPSPFTQQIQQWILGSGGTPGLESYPAMTSLTVSEGQALHPVAHVDTESEERPWTPPRPAQLPSGVPTLCGREKLFRDTVERMSADKTSPSIMATLVVNGPPGAGKTEFGLHVARQLADAGVCQLYADLGGSTNHPADPTHVLGEFLFALGANIHAIPEDLDYRSKALRTWTAGRDVLIMLDDAASVGQVRALMPGSSRCTVIVTGSHASLHVLATTSVRVGPLDLPDALAILDQLIGPDRVRRERAAAEELCRLCGGLPLALRCAGAKLMASPAWPMSSFVQLLAEEDGRLTELSHGDIDLVRRIDAPYQRLDEQEKSALRLASMFLGETVTVEQLADLMGTGRHLAERTIRSLVSHQLAEDTVDESSAVTGFKLPELVKVYARNRLNEMLSNCVPPQAERAVNPITSISA
jgi:DNA-binding SARP family transcriptional activator